MDKLINNLKARTHVICLCGISGDKCYKYGPRFMNKKRLFMGFVCLNCERIKRKKWYKKKEKNNQPPSLIEEQDKQLANELLELEDENRIYQKLDKEVVHHVRIKKVKPTKTNTDDLTLHFD